MRNFSSSHVKKSFDQSLVPWITFPLNLSLKVMLRRPYICVASHQMCQPLQLIWLKPCVAPLLPLEQRWIQNSSSLFFLAHNIHLAKECLSSIVTVPSLPAELTLKKAIGIKILNHLHYSCSSTHPLQAHI